MASFPNNPVANDQHIENGITYVYTGEKWKVVSTNTAFRGVVYAAANNAVTLDLSKGNIFEIQYSSNTTVTFSNPPASGNAQTFRVLIDAPAVDGFSLASASYDNVSSPVLAGSANGLGSTFKPDGTKLYYVEGTGVAAVFEHALAEPWNVSTASTTRTSFVLSGQDAVPQAVFFKPDGTMMYIVGSTNDKVYFYTLTIPWVVSSAVLYSNTTSVASQQTVPSSIFFKPDGTKMYVAGYTPYGVHQYSLSSPWLSGVSYDTKFLDTSAQSAAQGLCFSSDGSRVFVTNFTTGVVYQYNLTTPWDVSTGSYSGISYSVATPATGPSGVTFKPEGDKMYIFGRTNYKFYQFSTVPSKQLITWPASVLWAGIGAPVITPGKKHVFEFYTSDNGSTYMAYPVERDII